jgi:hypothetical protein
MLCGEDCSLYTSDATRLACVAAGSRDERNTMRPPRYTNVGLRSALQRLCPVAMEPLVDSPALATHVASVGVRYAQPSRKRGWGKR